MWGKNPFICYIRTAENSTEAVHEESKSQNIAYQWHQEERQTNQDRQYTNINEETHEMPKSRSITKTCLYNFDLLKPHFYIVKLGFTGVYIILLISV